LLASAHCLFALICATALAQPAHGVLPSRATTAVYTFPSPGSRFASPQTQIAFRGLSVQQLGSIVVRGSSSGVHYGRVVSDSDGDGGSFLPNQPFQPGEKVSVLTSVNVVGGSNRSFTFTVATPAPPNRTGTFVLARHVTGAAPLVKKSTRAYDLVL